MASRRGLVGGGGGSNLPALSDNGTTVTSTEPISLPNGAVGATSIQIGGANNGIYGSLRNLNISLNGTNGFLFNTNDVNYGFFFQNANGLLSWNAFSNSLLTGFTNGVRVGSQTAAAAPISQILQVGGDASGTDHGGGGATIRPGIGTGAGTATSVAINRNIVTTTGTSAQSQLNAFAVGQSKTLSNTSATAQTIATITLGSNAGGGCAGTFTIVATDGTNFDAETQSFNVSFVNKAGAVTVGSVVVTGSTAANNSGSATLGITAVANGNNVDIKVTPVFTTIVPTTVTLYPVITHSTNTVTFV